MLVNRLLIASDCQAVVKDISERPGDSNGAIIKEIVARPSEFEHCLMIHERRNSDHEEDSLAIFSFYF